MQSSSATPYKLTHDAHRLAAKDQEIQILRAELEGKTEELLQKMEQMHQQVRNDLNNL